MDTDCREIQPLLQLLLDGELAEPEATDVAHHVRVCRACATLVDQDRLMRKLLRQVHECDCQAPRSLHAGLRSWVREQTPIPSDRVSRRVHRTERRTFRPAELGRGAVAVAFALTVVVALSAGAVLGRFTAPPASAPGDDPSRMATAEPGPAARVVVADPRVDARPRIVRVDRVHLLDGPGLLYTFESRGRTRQLIQTADRTIELNADLLRTTPASPAPSALEHATAWSPPSGPVTVASFASLTSNTR